MPENELDKTDKVKISRSCIPSKEDPPEEMIHWLKTYMVCYKVLYLYRDYLLLLFYFVIFFYLYFMYRNGQMPKGC